MFFAAKEAAERRARKRAQEQCEREQKQREKGRKEERARIRRVLMELDGPITAEDLSRILDGEGRNG